MPEFTKLHRRIAEALYSADEPLSVSEIAERLGVEEGAVANAMPLLVKMGLARESYFMGEEEKEKWRKIEEESRKWKMLADELNSIFSKLDLRDLKSGIPEYPHNIPRDWQKTTLHWLFPNKAKTKEKEED